MKPDAPSHYSRRVLAVAAVILLVAMVVWHSAAGKALLARGLETFAQLALTNELAARALFVGLAAISAMVAPFSSVVLTPFAVNVWGDALTVVLLLTGWLLGGIVSFTLAYYAGFPLVQRLLGRERLLYYQQRISTRTAFRWARPPEESLGALSRRARRYAATAPRLPPGPGSWSR